MSARWIRIAGGAGLAAGVVALSYPILLRGKCLNWGARPDEISRELPGDDLLRDADIVATRAITIGVMTKRCQPVCRQGACALPGETVDACWCRGKR